MPKRLEGKYVVVTGGGSGIGRAVVDRFITEGAQIAILDRDFAAAQRAAAEAVESGGHAIAIHTDVSDSTSVAAAAQQTLESFPHINVLINNAGIMDGFASLLDTSEELWDRVIGVNVKGLFNVTKAFLPAIIDSGSGSVINTSSIAGVGTIGAGISYVASKHAVIGMTKHLAVTYAKSIRVNTVLPGAIHTPLTDAMLVDGTESRDYVNSTTPMGRPGNADEVANVMLFLASDESSYVNGATYAVDGGVTAV
ncbi:SDR family NAD(P)-dependent oxidoreductase [Streptomyces sp. NPDC059215]|uniref:SDR family NAD(P)-dependent oxidoreductase n=1 Tax=Streptomyces sp. NPDC059215 TaxID=3346772 RepID=UPI0036C56DBD